MSEDDRKLFMIGDHVRKVGGDYVFDGIVISAFMKISGKWRYAVEDDRGIVHIFNSRQLCERLHGDLVHI